MLTRWDINGIVLHHTNRFFQAATEVVLLFKDPDAEILGSMVTLAGNMLWARSSFEADDKEDERNMAFTGAVVGSLGSHIGQSTPAAAEQALLVLAGVQQELHTHYDPLLLWIERRLREQGVGRDSSPSAVNEMVWSLLFPQYRYGVCLLDLQGQIRARLLGGD